MAISRRKFLKAGTLVALSVGLPLEAAAEVLNPPHSLSGSIDALVNPVNGVSHLDMQAFSRCLRTNFSLSHANARSVTVKLVEVHDWLQNAATKTGRECFSLMFRGTDLARLQQNTYRVEHDSLGKFEMLLVPIGGKRVHYEAVFNRL